MFDTPLRAAAMLGGIGMVLELIAVLLHVRLVRRLYYFGVLFLTAFSGTLLLLSLPVVPSAFVAIIALYRIFNALRALSRQTSDERSFAVTNRSSMVLVSLQIISIGVLYVSYQLSLTNNQWMWFLMLTALIVSGMILISTIKNLRKTNLRPTDKYTPDADLPTVSVCIAARNETADLSACLASIIASDYPKLEILVLDDCSQDNTSEIIKGFAQDGVRFVAGEEPKKGWLAKNQAYQTLSEAASGELLLYSGVDVRFDSRAIRYLVATLIARHKRMVSVLPKGVQNNHKEGLIQPMRYWWELALPRQLFNRPPVLSTLWLIEKSALEELGNFKAVSNTVIPEAYLARQIARDDEFTFMRSNGKLRINSIKSFNEQWETAIRVRYPQLKKRPENVALLTISEVAVLVVPLLVLIIGFFVPLGLLWVIAGVTYLMQVYIHYRILKVWDVKDVSLLLALFPAACVVEILITQLSMWRYEFGEVEWKGRNICIPVMQAIPRLPKA
jgi:glycosyltransferase involved in cell wall biosynthesis